MGSYELSGLSAEEKLIKSLQSERDELKLENERLFNDSIRLASISKDEAVGFTEWLFDEKQHGIRQALLIKSKEFKRLYEIYKTKQG